MRKSGNTMERVAWQIYAAIFCGIQLVGMLQMEWIIEDIALSAWILLGCIPLLGFAFKFKAAIPLVWKAYFLLLIIVVGMFTTFLLFGAFNSGFNEAHGKTLLAMVIQVPFWYAVWAYAYRSKGLWVRNS